MDGRIWKKYCGKKIDSSLFIKELVPAATYAKQKNYSPSSDAPNSLMYDKKFFNVAKFRYALNEENT